MRQRMEYNVGGSLFSEQRIQTLQETFARSGMSPGKMTQRRPRLREKCILNDAASPSAVGRFPERVPMGEFRHGGLVDPLNARRLIADIPGFDHIEDDLGLKFIQL